MELCLYLLQWRVSFSFSFNTKNKEPYGNPLMPTPFDADTCGISLAPACHYYLNHCFAVFNADATLKK